MGVGEGLGLPDCFRVASLAGFLVDARCFRESLLGVSALSTITCCEDRMSGGGGDGDGDDGVRI